MYVPIGTGFLEGQQLSSVLRGLFNEYFTPQARACSVSSHMVLELLTRRLTKLWLKPLAKPVPVILDHTLHWQLRMRRTV